MNDRDRAIWWENTAKRHRDEADYYRAELVKAHALLGRVVHQFSERWDTVNITEFYPTDNLHRNRTTNNPSGKPETPNNE